MPGCLGRIPGGFPIRAGGRSRPKEEYTATAATISAQPRRAHISRSTRPRGGEQHRGQQFRRWYTRCAPALPRWHRPRCRPPIGGPCHIETSFGQVCDDTDLSRIFGSPPPNENQRPRVASNAAIRCRGWNPTTRSSSMSRPRWRSGSRRSTGTIRTRSAHHDQASTSPTTTSDTNPMWRRTVDATGGTKRRLACAAHR